MALGPPTITDVVGPYYRWTAPIIPGEEIMVFPIGPVVAAQGGTVVLVEGTNFEEPISVLVDGSVPAYIADTRFDLLPTQLWLCLPRMPIGDYTLHLTTTGGTTVYAPDLRWRRFVEEHKIHRVRTGLSARWKTGPRILSNDTIGLEIP